MSVCEPYGMAFSGEPAAAGSLRLLETMAAGSSTETGLLGLGTAVARYHNFRSLHIFPAKTAPSHADWLL